jgi:hypothetical protein
LAHAAEIPQGTHVLLRLMNSISTRTAHEGDYVYLRLSTPISVDGQVVVPAESYAQGVVSHAKRSGRVSGHAELGIRIETFAFANGKALKVSPRLASVDSAGTTQKVESKENEIKQGGSTGTDAAHVATIAGSGAAIGGIADQSWKGAGLGAGIGAGVGLATVLFTRGKEVELRQGATIDVVFDRPVTME